MSDDNSSKTHDELTFLKIVKVNSNDNYPEIDVNKLLFEINNSILNLNIYKETGSDVSINKIEILLNDIKKELKFLINFKNTVKQSNYCNSERFDRIRSNINKSLGK